MIIKAKKAIIVARVSTEEQAKEGHHSIPAQLLILRKYAEPFDVVKEFQIQESAFQGNRKKFKKVFKEVEKYDEPIAIICDTVSRFTREWDVTRMADDLRKEGKIELHFVTEKGTLVVIHQYSKPLEIGDWEQAVLDAKKFSLRISASVRKSVRYRLGQRQLPGYAPTGYLQPEKTVVQDKERAPLVKECFEKYASGDYSTAELAGIMREKGFTMKPKNGKEPRPVAKFDIVEMLNNLFYTGRFKWFNPENGKREIHQGSYEPIISEELYEKVQRVLDEKNIKNGIHHSSTKFFKFRGLVKCAFCGCGLTPNDLSKNYKNKQPGQAVYYRCTCSKKSIDPNWYMKKFGTKNCPQRYWREEEIEELIKENLEEIHYDKKVFHRLRDELNREFQTQIKLSEAQRMSLKTDLKEKERLRDALIDKMVLADGDIEFEFDMKDRVKAVRKEIDNIKEEVKVFEQMEDFKTDEFVDTLVLCSDLRKQYDKLSDTKKRQLVILAFKEIVAKKGEVKVIRAGKPIKMDVKAMFFAWREPFFTLEKIGFEKWLAKDGDKLGKEASESMQRSANRAKKVSLNKSKDSVPKYSY